ncbi:MAG: murein L,D-transpeptidase [Rhodanobacteraceae bacterium]|nr:murein L,D-transpeptidase [Rhodanobacteraceae bacterium]
MMRALLLSLAVLMNTTAQPNNIPSNARSAQAEARVQAALTAELKAMGADWGAPLYLRIFKASDELEVWVATGERYQHLRTWPICTWSGDLGPKLSQGDGQAPEGFYEVAAQQLNPASRFHLSFNLGYPNAYDRAHGRTGDFLMVHGNCVSVGCYAMGDAAIEEIYTLVAAALTHGQRAVPVHAFPFRMDDDWEARHAGSEWLPFWRQLAAGYRAFGQTGQPPRVRVVDGEYRLREG